MEKDKNYIRKLEKGNKLLLIIILIFSISFILFSFTYKNIIYEQEETILKLNASLQELKSDNQIKTICGESLNTTYENLINAINNNPFICGESQKNTYENLINSI